MQEQKKYKIEKVEHNYYSMLLHRCCIIDYSNVLDELFQYNYIDENTARKDKVKKSVGMWRIKQQKLNH